MERIKKDIKLDLEDVDWLKSTYPKVSLSWLLTMLLKEFRGQHDKSPTDYAKLGAAELKRTLEEQG